MDRVHPGSIQGVSIGYCRFSDLLFGKRHIEHNADRASVLEITIMQHSADQMEGL